MWRREVSPLFAAVCKIFVDGLMSARSRLQAENCNGSSVVPLGPSANLFWQRQLVLPIQRAPHSDNSISVCVLPMATFTGSTRAQQVNNVLLGSDNTSTCSRKRFHRRHPRPRTG